MSRYRKVIFSKHARSQFEERKISGKEVEQILESPYRVTKQSTKRFRISGKIKRFSKDYLLVIICDREDSVIKIVTAFVTSKLRKYS